VTTRLALYAVTAPGLESLTAAELRQLGIEATGVEPGGVAFQGTLADVARANLWLRTPSRILLRLGTFHVRALGELERKAGQLPWREWLVADRPLTVRATCRKSRLFHQGAVAERVLAASGGRPASATLAPDEKEGDTAQLVVVRLFRDEATISLDSSGALLHRRGYRLETAKAPLRETLAAALLLASGWHPGEPLVDPFCGSGTIPIEAALLARRLPPGLHRSFAFRHWAGWDEADWRSLIDAARDQSLSRAPSTIIAADRDAGAIEAARANAARAGVEQDIEFRCEALSLLDPPAGMGHLVSNPPYGVRVGEPRALRDLYTRLGQVARERLAGWRLTLLLPTVPLERAIGLAFTESLRTSNGGLTVRAVHAHVQARGAVDGPAGAL
jgi:putative N6-adenine-specific DNA methylase